MASQYNENSIQILESQEAVRTRPAMYIGTIEPNMINTFVIDNTNKIIKKDITYIPGLFKIFDEALVNAIDHSVRTREEFHKGKTDIQIVKNIRINK